MAEGGSSLRTCLYITIVPAPCRVTVFYLSSCPANDNVIVLPDIQLFRDKKPGPGVVPFFDLKRLTSALMFGSAMLLTYLNIPKMEP